MDGGPAIDATAAGDALAGLIVERHTVRAEVA